MRPVNGGRGNDDPGNRTEDGAGAEPPHVPPDGEDSRLRGAGARALQEREDAGPGPPLYRRGGCGGWGSAGAAAGRPPQRTLTPPPPITYPRGRAATGGC